MIYRCPSNFAISYCVQRVRGLDRDRDIGSANGEQQWQGAGPEHPALPTFQTCCRNVVYFVVGCFWKLAMGDIWLIVLRFESILVPLAFWKGQRIFVSRPWPGPGPVVNSHWHMRMAASICMANSLKITLQSVGISTSNPWCRRFVPMLPSRFRSSWFCPLTFRTLASSSQEDMAVAGSKARPWDDFRCFWGRVVDPS